MEGKFITNEVRNSDGIWINSQVFREEGKHFMKYGYYCASPRGTNSYKEYWDEQLQRCKVGYSVGGAKITQHHYFYLNFTQITVAEQTGGKTAKKVIKHPDFWDGDYNYFWAIEIAKNGLFTNDALAPSTQEEREEYWRLERERMLLPNSQSPSDFIESELKRNSDLRYQLEEKVLKRLQLLFTIEVDWRDGGHHMIVGKSRRKGYSFKNAAICANIYNTIRGSLTLIGAFDKKYLYPTGTMGMASSYLSFLNKHTAWAKAREYVDKQEHKRSSFIETLASGVKVEAGYRSEIMAITFKDNPDAARGKDSLLTLLEEGGAFPNFEEAIQATAPGLTAGKYITGQIIGYGTGGDMESGTKGFANVFYHPKEFNMMPFINIWDEEAHNSSCCFFHPVSWNMEGHYDEQGNSDIEGAKAVELATRKELIANSSSSLAIQGRVQEWPLNPAEAFLTVSMNDFPIVELRNRYNKVIRESLHLKAGQPVELYREDGKVIARPDLDGRIQPLWDYKPKTTDLRGGVVIYEYPVANAPKGLYKIGFDPYRQQNSSETVPSLAAIYVYKSNHKFSYSRDTIVAQYIGRPYDPDIVNRIAELLAELYNAEVMHENEVTHVKDYFRRVHKLHLLASQPDAVISSNIRNSLVDRVYGIHMADKLKDAGEKYIKKWLLTVRDYDEKGNPILNLDTICDPALLDELILYNRKGNFDRVMAFMMVMFQLAEEEEGMIYGDDDRTATGQELIDLMQRQFKNTRDGVHF